MNKAEIIVSFGEIIKIRRTQLEIDQKQIATALNLSRTMIGKIERGEREPLPSKEQIETIAAVLDMDSKFLLGSMDDFLEQYPIDEETTRYIQKDQKVLIFGNVIKNRREQLNKTQQGLADVLHLSRASISKMEQGYRESLPPKEQIQLIAEFLEMNVDILMGSNNEILERFDEEDQKYIKKEESTAYIKLAITEMRRDEALLEIARNKALKIESIEMDCMKALGIKIKELRESKGWSLKELEIASNVSEGVIRRIEMNMYNKQSYPLSAKESLGKIAIAIGTTLEELPQIPFDE